MALSGSIAVTRSGRNPGHAGGGAASARPALPMADSGWSRIDRNDARQPGLSAGMRSARATSVPRVAGQIEQTVRLGDGHLLRARGDLDDVVARLDPALRQHPEVEARPVVRDQERRDPGVVHPDAHPVTGDPRLTHLEQRLADPEPVPDAHLVVRQSVDGEVLPELAVAEVVPPQEPPPVLVGTELVDEDGTVLPTVTAQVTLPVAVEVEARHPHRPVDRRLPHTRVDRAATPPHVLGHADINRP